MSLILDALRKADADRQRGQAPGLQQVAQQPALAVGPGLQRSGSRLALPVAITLLLLGLAAASWWLGWPRSGGSAASQPASAPGTLARPQPAARAGAPGQAPAMPIPLPAQVPAHKPAPRVPVVSLAPQAPSPASSPPPNPPPVQPRAASRPLPPMPLSALTPQQRAAIVQLGIGGGVHSSDRTQRFVLMGGQIAREGAVLARDIVLERIDARSVVLIVDGQRVEVPL